jgi:glycyl-tRNA synthetase beta chain
MAKRPTSRKPASKRQPEAMKGDLLLEIGTEELPYQFIAPAMRSLEASAERLFKEHRLSHGAIRTFATPRRLTLTVAALAGRQTATVKEAMGPSQAVAFDPAGQPTKAAIGFAASQGLAVGDLEVRQMPKGSYVFAVKREEGGPAQPVLAELLPALIASLNFPKAMKWNESGLRFARPIRWLLALYSGKVIPFQLGGVKSGNKTWGHRFLGPAAKTARQGIPVKDVKSYLSELERGGVIADQNRRRTLIDKQLDSLAKSVRGHLHRDEDLLEQAVQTVEYPQAILGGFHERFLSLPKDVIMTAMKEHQGFFALSNKDGTLLPRFISVTNMKLAGMKLIQQGNERVLAARLSDAKFYFDEDRKVKLADRTKQLKDVTFHQKLGTIAQKRERIKRLIEMWVKWLELSEQIQRDCLRAADLCKADLLTGVVREFPKLQGIMGGEYARLDGESHDVSTAIAEHYLPDSPDGKLPSTITGKVLSIADRLDTIVGFFRVGIIPSGSEDPFALRRHAWAIVRMLIEGDHHLNLAKAINQTWNVVGDSLQLAPAKDGEAELAVLSFFIERFKYYSRTVHNIREDVIEALAVRSPQRFYDLVDLLARMTALQAVTARPEFDPLMVGFKRAHRLVEKENWKEEEVNPSLFQHQAETDLHKALEEARLQVPFAIEQGNHAKALEGLVRLKPAIDAFFTGVMVNTEDQGLRKNRLSLLCAVDRLFMRFADFSQVVVQGT